MNLSQLNEQVKKRIFFTIAAIIFALGIWGTLTRKDPIEKNIGYVYLNDGEEIFTLNGYKTETNYKGKIKKYDFPDLQEKSDEVPSVVVTEENISDMNVSYSDNNYKAEYTLYDSDFSLISENMSRLELPSETDKTYFISVSVLWGSKDENVNMIYYFSIET